MAVGYKGRGRVVQARPRALWPVVSTRTGRDRLSHVTPSLQGLERTGSLLLPPATHCGSAAGSVTQGSH